MASSPTTTSSWLEAALGPQAAEWIPTNEQLKHTLDWLRSELSSAEAMEKKTKTKEDARQVSPFVRHALEALTQMEHVLLEKNPQAHLQTALRGLLLLQHDLQRQRQDRPFRLSEDPRQQRLDALHHSASALARHFGMALIAGEEEHLTSALADVLGVLSDLFTLAHEEDEAHHEATQPERTILVQPKGTTYKQIKARLMGENAEEEKEEEKEEPQPTTTLPSRSQMTKGKVVPPSVMSLAGPSTDLPDVLPTAGYQLDAVFPGTHVPTALPDVVPKDTHTPVVANVPRSQLTKGKVVPPSVMALAGPSTDLPEVLPTAPDQPLAVFPGMHAVPSVPGGPQPASLEEQHRQTRVLSEEQLMQVHRRFVRSINTLAQSDMAKHMAKDWLNFIKALCDVAATPGGMENSEQSLQDHLVNILRSTKALAEGYLGGRSLDSLIHRFVEVWELSIDNKHAEQFFASAYRHLYDVFDNPNLLCQSSFQEEGTALLRTMREINDTSLRGRLTGLVAEMALLTEKLTADTSLMEFRHGLVQLTRDLLINDQGQLAINRASWRQIQNVISKGVQERWEIALPCITVGDFFKVTLVGGRMAARHLVPHEVLIEDRGKMLLQLNELRDPTVRATAHGVRVLLRGINMDIHDAPVTIASSAVTDVLPTPMQRLLALLPIPELALEDKGKLSVLMGGRGMDLTLTIRTHTSQERLIEVDRIQCEIHDIDFFLSGTKHDTLYNTLLTAFTARIKQEVERAIERNLAQTIEAFQQGIAGNLLHNLALHSLDKLKDTMHLATLAETLLTHNTKAQEGMVQDVLRQAFDSVENKQRSHVASK